MEYYYLNNYYLFLFNKLNFSCTIINDNTGTINYDLLPSTEYKYLFIQKTIEDDYIIIIEYDTANNIIYRIMLYYYLTNELIIFKNNEVPLNFEIGKNGNTNYSLNVSENLQHIELDIENHKFYYLENGLNLKYFDCNNNTDVTTNIVLTEPCRNLVLIDNIFYCFAEPRGYYNYYLTKGNKIVAIILNEQDTFSIINSNISSSKPNSYKYSTIICNSKTNIFCLFLSNNNYPDQVSVLQKFNKNTNTWENLKISSDTFNSYYFEGTTTLSGYCKWLYTLQYPAQLVIIDPITLHVGVIYATLWSGFVEEGSNIILDLSLYSKYYDFSIWENGKALCGSIKNNNNLPFLYINNIFGDIST